MVKFADYADEVRAAHQPKRKAKPSPWGVRSPAMEHEDELEALPDWAPGYLEAFDKYLRSGTLADRLTMRAHFLAVHPEYARRSFSFPPGLDDRRVA